MSDYYEALGVSRRASTEEITAAYKAIVVKYHPDRHAQNDLKELAEEKLKRANAAYQVLSNPQRRRVYDAGGIQRRSHGSPMQEVHVPPRSLLKMVLLTGGWIVASVLAFRLSHNPKLFIALLAGVFIWRQWRKRKQKRAAEEEG